MDVTCESTIIFALARAMIPDLTGDQKASYRWFRQAGAVLLCTLLCVFWLEELGWHKNPTFMIKIEGNCRLITVAKHIFGDNLENYFKRDLSRFNPLQRVGDAK